MNTILKVILGVLMAVTVAVLGYALASGGSDQSISLNLMWAYSLAGLAVVSVLFCTVYGLLLSPGGLLKSLISAVVVAAVVGVAYFYASSHEILIPNIGDGGFFDASETIITEASIVVAYVLGAGAVLSAIFSEVMGALK